MPSESTFINPGFVLGDYNRDKLFNQFDILGQVQSAENIIDIFEEKVISSLVDVEKILSRQRTQQNTLRLLLKDIADTIFAERVARDSLMLQAKTLLQVWQKSNDILEWSGISYETLDENMEVITKDSSLSRIDNQTINVIASKNVSYIKVTYSLSEGEAGGFIIDDHVSNIEKIEISTGSGEYVEIDKDLVSSSIGIFSYSSQVPIPVMQSSASLRITYKTKKIDNNSYLYVKAYAFNLGLKEIEISSNSLQTELPINTLWASTTFQNEVIDAKIITQNKVYNFQIPNINNNQQLTRLELVGYGNSYNESYFKFPFPANINSFISVYKSLDIDSTKQCLFDYAFSLEGPWKSSEVLQEDEYPNIDTFSKEKRYLYIRLNFFAEVAYAIHSLKNLNCTWYLSEDKKIILESDRVNLFFDTPVKLEVSSTSAYSSNLTEGSWLNQSYYGLIFPKTIIGIL